MLYQWVFPETTDTPKKIDIPSQFELHPIIAQILAQRSITSSEQIQRFFEPKLEFLYDPFKLPGMERAVERIIKALRDGENILIYGDYDVDGVTSVSILYDSLFKLGGKVSFFIPSRFHEGYGFSEAGIRFAQNNKASLIITVDCGITAIEEVELANAAHIDVIISDHHEPGEIIPNAVAVLDPKMDTNAYPFTELAGCGVAYKLLQGLTAKLGLEPDFPEQYLDLVALGTAADIVELKDENRILVKAGLDRIRNNPRPGVFALMEISGLRQRRASVSNIVFVLAPRLNAVGRISTAKKAVHLLTAKSLQQARNIARILEKENKTRKNIDEITFTEAKQMIEDTIDLDKKRVLVLAKRDWHPGVIGIVASRLMEKFNRPTILLSVQEGIGKGSARSTVNFDVFAAFKQIGHLFLNYGGHRFAAGLTIKEEDIAELDRAINSISQEFLQIDQMVPKLAVDAEVSFEQLDATFFNSLKQMAPFGPGNMRPVFVSRGLSLYGEGRVVGKNHLKAKFKQNGVVLDAIGYKLGEYVPRLKESGRYDCAYVLEESVWNGQTTIQMKIKDIEVIDG